MSFLSFQFRIYHALARQIVPEVRATQHVYHDWLRRELNPGCDWLDLGCGHQILPAWVQADEPALVGRCRRVVGVDLDFPSLVNNHIVRDRVMGNLEYIPFASEMFDLVTANMVFEHLQDPAGVLGEVKRVLRPGGRLLVHTPNRQAPAIRIAAQTPEGLKKSLIWLFERRHEEDVFPTHYRINTSSDIQSLASSSGFVVERILQLSNAAVTAILGPFALPELLYLRVIEGSRFAELRSNLLFVLRKPAA